MPLKKREFKLQARRSTAGFRLKTARSPKVALAIAALASEPHPTGARPLRLAHVSLVVPKLYAIGIVLGDWVLSGPLCRAGSATRGCGWQVGVGRLHRILFAVALGIWTGGALAQTGGAPSAGSHSSPGTAAPGPARATTPTTAVPGAATAPPAPSAPLNSQRAPPSRSLAGAPGEAVPTGGVVPAAPEGVGEVALGAVDGRRIANRLQNLRVENMDVDVSGPKPRRTGALAAIALPDVGRSRSLGCRSPICQQLWSCKPLSVRRASAAKEPSGDERLARPHSRAPDEDFVMARNRSARPGLNTSQAAYNPME
jgi:hypothetical protein